MANLDFVAIGDPVVDDFIRLKDAATHCKIDNEECELCVRFGDKVPFESSTKIYGVGNAANAAVSAARLGLSTGMVATIGKDDYGERIVANFKNENIDTTWVRLQEGAPTNYHYVLWYGDERTILVNHYHYDYTMPQDLLEPKIVYLSSLAAGTEDYHDAISTYLEAHPAIFFVFQPGTFQIKLGAERLKRLYARANLFVVNKEESQLILGLPDTADDMPPLLTGLHALGPKTVVITDYLDGCYGYENGTTEHLPMYKDPKPPVERTGAGDAFASTTAAYYGSGSPLKDAMQRGLINAAYVVQDIGAQRGLLKRDTLDQLFNTLR